MLENLYQYYDEKNISKDDFNKIFNTVYDVLKLKINDDEIQKAMVNYLSLLIADARDRFNVDINWCIKYIWYLCAGIPSKEMRSKYKDCISFIQQKLLKEFIMYLEKNRYEYSKKELATIFEVSRATLYRFVKKVKEENESII